MIDINKLKSVAKEIVTRKDVKYVIGYEKGTYGWRVSPSFAKTSEDVDKFIFSPLCTNNLATYLAMENRLGLPLQETEKERSMKIGVVVKGCDSRAIIHQLQENDVVRSDVIVIGVPCSGVIDSKKMKQKFGNIYDNVEVEEVGDTYIVDINGEKTEVLKSELISDVCKTCQYQNPLLYDVLIGEKIEQKNKEDYSAVEVLEEKSVDERWAYWQNQFDKCIRCYACRNICPVCNCKVCMADNLNPVWIRRSVNISENTSYHVMRAFHMAGGCISCGNCERACPVDIPLMELYKKVEKDVLEMFDYRPGISQDDSPLLSTFSIDDSNEGIL